MAAPPSDRVVEWEGTSLADLVSALQVSALPVRIEVIAPGPVGSGAGEVHLLAGGLADAFAGSLRRDDAMAALQRLEGARFLVECRLPDPESGSLAQAGPATGSLKDRPLPKLMRYCEDYVLTCQVEVSRGSERAVVNYKRGELLSTTVDGNDADDRLPDMLAWRDGTYEIVLATPELPPAPQRRRDSQPLPRVVEAAAKADRKRHSTLPGTGSRPAGNTPVPGSAVKTSAKGPDVTLPFASGKGVALPTAAAPPARAPAVPPVSSLRLSPAPELPGPGRVPSAAKAGAPDAALAQQMTKRGLPSIPAVPPVPQPPLPRPIPAAAVKAAAPPAAAAKPATGAAVAAAPVSAAPKIAPATPAGAKPAAPSPAKPATSAAPPAPVASKPAAPAPVAPAKPPAPAVQPAAVAKAPSPVQAPAKPAAPAAPSPFSAKPAAPAPVSAKAATAGPSTKSGMPSVQTAAAAKPVAPPAAATAQPMAPTPLPSAPPPAPAPVAAKPPVAPPSPTVAAGAAKPPVAPASPTVAAGATTGAPEAITAPIVRKGVTAPRMGAVQAPVAKGAPSASNDLKPASGLIEARPRRLSHPRPAASPVEVAEEPPPISRPMTPAPVTPQMAAQRRGRTSASARKKTSGRPVRIYVLMGLAIGIGIVVAYWLYFSMNVGR